MLLGCVTHAAQGFKVVQTEELKNFPVGDALLVHLPFLLPRPAGRPRGAARPAVLLPQEGVGHVLQRQADRGLRQRALLPADGTLASGLLLVPELLQTGPAEAVAALEDDGVPEDLAADGARQVLLQHGARARGHGPRPKGRGRLGALEEGKYSRLGGGPRPQRHGPFCFFR